jgi:hypothetical protein
MNTITHTRHLTAAGLVLAAAGSVQAADFQSSREIAAFLKERMPMYLQDDATRRRLVGEMLKVPIATPLTRSFDANRAVKALLGDGSVIPSADCRRTGSPVGERDPGDCTASIGDESGTGAFSRLSYSKSLGFGNIEFVKRAAIPSTPPTTDPPSPKGTDGQYFEEALKLLGGVLGLPVGPNYGGPDSISEIPLPPNGARLPVRNLNVQGSDGQERSKPVTVQKVVILKRGFPLATPIPIGNFQLTHLPGPGTAMVMFDANGVSGVSVQNWHDLRIDPTMTEEDTKSGDALMEEIAEDLFNDGVRSASDMKFHAIIASEQRNQIGLLLPAVQVAVLPGLVLKDPTEDEQAKLALQTTAALLKEYSLVERKPDSNAGRPRPD